MDQTAQRGWWGRNWKWVVPVGCLGLLLLFGVILVIVILFLVFGLIKSSDAYEGALDAARSDPELIQALGTPIEDGLFPTGSVEESGPSGEAEFTIPVSGPNGSATVYVQAEKFGGEWVYRTLVAELEDSGRRIDLLDRTEEPGSLDGRGESASGGPVYPSFAWTTGFLAPTPRR